MSDENRLYRLVLPVAAALCACTSGEGSSAATPSEPKLPRTYQADVKLDPGAVALFGTLAEGIGVLGAVANLDHPELAMVGFPGETHHVRVAPDGAIWFNVASIGALRGLYRATPDGFTRDEVFDDHWHYPADPTSNDRRISGPCDLDPDNDVLAFVIQEGTGEVAYRCKSGIGFPWYDAHGVVRARDLERVWAWNANGLMLARSRYGVDALFAPDGTFRQLKPPLEIRAARAHGDGFWVAAPDLPPEWPPTAMLRYFISPEGIATLDGVFAPAPPEFYCGSPDQPIGYPMSEELSAAGELYGIGYGPPIFTWRDVVCRRPLLPGTTEVVYDEALDPRRDGSAAPTRDRPVLWTRIHMSRLVTGP